MKIRGDKYVSLAKVEMAINKIPLVDNSCVCASESENHTVALICPNAQDMQVTITPPTSLLNAEPGSFFHSLFKFFIV